MKVHSLISNNMKMVNKIYFPKVAIHIYETLFSGKKTSAKPPLLINGKGATNM